MMAMSVFWDQADPLHVQRVEAFDLVVGMNVSGLEILIVKHAAYCVYWSIKYRQGLAL